MDSAFMCSVTQDLWKTNAAAGKCRMISDRGTARRFGPLGTAWNRTAFQIAVKASTGSEIPVCFKSDKTN